MSSKELDNALIGLCEAFNRHGVRYVVVGGFAVIMHGRARMTEDIDFFIDDSPDNINKLKSALKTIYDDPSIEEISPEVVKEYAVIRYGTPDDFNLDFIGKIGDMFSFAEVKAGAEVFEIDSIKIPVCGLEMLIRMKETVRDRDVRDLRFLKRKAEERKRR